MSGVSNDRARALTHLFDLVRELLVRDIKVRYKRSFVGLGWSLLNPLLQVAVLSVVFRYLLPLNVPDFTLFLFTGILVWGWFQDSLHSATAVIVHSGPLLKQPGFPVAVLPVISVASSLVHFLLALPILLAALWITGHRLSGAIAMLPLLIVLQFGLLAGLSYFLAALHVKFRDTQHLLGVALLLGFYLAPVFYEPRVIPGPYRLLYNLNPMVHLIGGYRAALMRAEVPDLAPLALIAVFSAILTAAGISRFRKASRRFLEEL